MSKRKTTKIWLIRGLLVFGILTIAALILAPGLINLEVVRTNIADNISRDIGGEIKYRRLQLSYFPRPHVVIHKAELSIPESFRIKIHRLKIYPKIFQMLLGNLQVAYIRLEYADYFMKLPQIRDSKPKPKEISSIDDIIKSITRALGKLPEFKLPDLNLKIRHGKVNLVDPFGRTFKLRQMQGDYHRSSDKLDFAIRCKSNLWEQIDINGSLNPSNLKGLGQIRLSRFRPQELFSYLLPNSAMQVADTRANVAIAFELDGNGNIRADIDGAIPLLQLSQGDEKLAIKGGHIKGNLQIGGSTAKVSITELGLNYPKLKVSGIFSYDEKLSDIQLVINGSEIDAAAVRYTALTLIGNSQTIVDIFDIIRGGHVPWMTVRIQGRTVAELGVLENIVIKGRMIQGKIFIPEVDLDLVDVVGDAVISKGVLQGDNLQARTGNSRGRNGTMTLGLNERILPFNLKIGVDADLSQLPPVLARIVEDQDFRNELDRIQDVDGNATGTLTLDNDPEGFDVNVEVTKVKLSAVYNRLPYPVKIDGGDFRYTRERIAFNNFNVTIGRTSLSKLSSSIKLTGKPSLAAKSREAEFDLKEFHSWLLSFDEFEKYLTYFSPLKGSSRVKNLSIAGPFFRPENWQIQAQGALNDIAIKIKKMPESLRLVSGEFDWQKSQIIFNDVGAAMGKSSVSELTAIFGLGKSSSLAIHAKSAEVFAAEMSSWLSSFEKTEAALKDITATAGIFSLENLSMEGPVHDPAVWHYSVKSVMKGITLNSDAFGNPVTVKNGILELAGESTTGVFRRVFDVKPSQLEWGDTQLTLSGVIESDRKDVRLDMDISAGGAEWAQAEKILDYIQKSKTESEAAAHKHNLLGNLNVQIESFQYDGYSVQPLHSEVAFETDKVTITINRAAVCSITFQGLIKVTDQAMDIYMVPSTVNQDLATTTACFTGEKNLTKGSYNLSGELLSKSKPDEFLRSMSGNVAFSSEEGRIYRFGLLAKILAILNFTEIYRGEVPDLTGEGFAYNSITINAEVKGGKLIMQECTLDGVSMGLACEGNIDLADKKMNLIVLVAPFKTVDRIVAVIPLIGHILGGKLISIPFKAKGDLKDPEVILLPPSAVGANVLGILERTLKLPITIIQPIISAEKNEKSDQKEGDPE